ncbi:hypothetical protein [Bradyrhizobium canariense]|uniref:hypothetical protein n=1 Tax=Bradyrhizobium canariense TaxID=255045 RepID=UPI001177B2E0|nr:hypothetical protein [Bradyrhizobium canariense]
MLAAVRLMMVKQLVGPFVVRFGERSGWPILAPLRDHGLDIVGGAKGTCWDAVGIDAIDRGGHGCVELYRRRIDRPFGIV